MHIYSFFRKILPWWVRYYYRLQIMGIENLPKNKSAIIAPNHSGGYDFDNFTLMSAMEHFITTNPARKRIWLCYHDKWVYYPGWGELVQQFSPIPISLEGKGIPWEITDIIVKKGELIAIMPEGHSACIWEQYNLWKFYPGVIKLHLRYEIPIIPAAMLGFVNACPITSVRYNREKIPPWDKEIMFIPPIIPQKLKIIYGNPIEFPEYYGRHVTKQEMYKLAALVRVKIKELIKDNCK